MASFPGTNKTFAARSNGQVIDAAHVGDLQDEVAAIEDGYLNGTARLNSSGSTMVSLNVTGSMTIASAPVAMTLLRASNGTTTTAVAENVDTVAISGLTANDTLEIRFTLEAVTQQTATIQPYNNTDGVAFVTIRSVLAAGKSCLGRVQLRQMQNLATRVGGNVDAVDEGGTSNGNGAVSAVTTAWTGSWTLALRHAGVTAGGTFRWSWAVYRVAGQ